MAKILVVDDEITIRMLYVYVFQDAGHTVMEAENGRKALELIEKSVPDAMLLDVDMPLMRGPELAAELRRLAVSRPELGKIPYIVMTGVNYAAEGAGFAFERDKSFKGYVPKMTPPEQVLAMIEEALK